MGPCGTPSLRGPVHNANATFAIADGQEQAVRTESYDRRIKWHDDRCNRRGRRTAAIDAYDAILGCKRPKAGSSTEIDQWWRIASFEFCHLFAVQVEYVEMAIFAVTRRRLVNDKAVRRTNCCQLAFFRKRYRRASGQCI